MCNWLFYKAEAVEEMFGRIAEKFLDDVKP
jgi:hypothetical protein